MTNYRKSDTQQERLILNFLCEKIYPEIYKVIVPEVSSAELQKRGVDVLLPDGNHDVKAQLKKYINHPTNTFSLEVLFSRNNNSDTIGWFLNNGLLTDYYDLVWITNADTIGTDNETQLVSSDAIHEAEIVIVKKNTLYDLFTTNKIHAKDILDMANQMRINNIRESYIGPFKLVYSSSFIERPVNIILSKKTYQSLSKIHIKYDRGRIITYRDARNN